MNEKIKELEEEMTLLKKEKSKILQKQSDEISMIRLKITEELKPVDNKIKILHQQIKGIKESENAKKFRATKRALKL